EGSPAAGRSLADLELPRDATVVAVVRHDRLVVPRGDTVLCSGDEVMVLVSGDAEHAVQRLLVGT
ncbi:MAG TPA: TrkA C-terminal domain-containing protein, partial [Acidimicrobiales bacterium]|nr:TrkA C-terminal domain-containing protein [Acidimicrobiales bacterium]